MVEYYSRFGHDAKVRVCVRVRGFVCACLTRHTRVCLGVRDGGGPWPDGRGGGCKKAVTGHTAGPLATPHQYQELGAGSYLWLQLCTCGLSG